MANNKPKTREEIIRQDMQDLHKLGYAQQLFREMGGFSNFAISFSIISILTGAILLYGYGLGFAGPIINTYGWPLVSFFVLCIAASMAELASAYPTAGGLYFWAHRLGGHRWAWVTAWFNMLGQIMITAGIDFAAAIYIAGAFNRIVGTNFDTTNTMTVVIVMIIIMIPQMLINIFGIRLTAKLSDFSVWWHIGGVAIMVLLLVLFGKFKNEFGFLFQSQVTVNPNDIAYEFAAGPFTFDSIMMKIPGMAGLYATGGLVLAFTLGLLQAQWTYTGYDASAHVAEETVMARLNSAWGVFLSVAVSSIVGYIMLLTLTLHIPNGLAGIADVVAGENSPAVLYVVYQNFDVRIFSDIIAIIIGVAMWLCGLSSITSMSRMWYAFARDNGMPGSSLIKQIHPQLRTPVWAIVITCTLAVLLTVYSVVYSVIVAVSTTALYLAYGIPIYLNLRNKLGKKGEYTTPKTAPWSLRGFGPVINVIALLWIVFITILFSIPPNELAGWSIIILGVFMFLYWKLDAGKRFTGPSPADEAELRRIETELAKLAHSAD
ncbi:MAG TPA: amino acid transporter [Chloroflexi bacterium]|nr:amino acid transporter [Chloroflexota bacterium]HHW86655.1 amino acid permease [Chloroflexota bacterium]